MPNQASPLHPGMTDPRMFWWVFALRGGFALLFAGLLFFVRTLLGRIFFDPVMLVYISLLLGFYVLGNGVIFGVAGIYALQHRLEHARLLLSESLFGVALGIYIARSLFVTGDTLALLAGIHAFGVGLFQVILAYRLRGQRPAVSLLGSSALLSWLAGVLFMANRSSDVAVTTQWLANFELVYGAIVVAFAVWMHRKEAPAYLTV